MMSEINAFLKRRLNPHEAVAVFVVLAALGWASYWSYEFAAAKMLEAKVDAAFPKVCEEIRKQRQELVSAIEAYKVMFGSYPPDHVLRRQPLVVDPVTNTLFYELMGTLYDPTNKRYSTGGTEPAEESYVRKVFQIDGFKNCGEAPDKVTRFLKSEPVPARQLHDDPDLFAVGFVPSYEEIAPEIVLEFQTSPWRYVSTAATNSPGKYDLWIELKAGKREVVIGNWKAVE